METKLAFKDNFAIIGPNQPFAVIGERINPTRRKKLAQSMAQGDFTIVQEDALKQVAAGAQILDVNAGIPGADEPALLRGATQAVMEVAQVPLCFDSANPDALSARLWMQVPAWYRCSSDSRSATWPPIMCQHCWLPSVRPRLTVVKRCQNP